ncbi:MAG: uridine kinase [Nitrososphaerota archaeon]|nr:uridine kinase [Nitrososphaerota archaeon]
MSLRLQFVGELADICSSIRLSHPLRVAIDGIDAAGKTSLAEELVEPIRERGREVLRASIDGFHKPRSRRYERGRDSAEGYYLDSFNNEALITELLRPLGPKGNLKYRTAVFDFKTDSPVDSPVLKANRDAILLFDGVFLFRPELLANWDLKIFLDIDFLVAVERSCLRDPEFTIKPAEVLTRTCDRYMRGNRMYLDRVRPKELADIVIDNNELKNPRLQIRNELHLTGPN